MANHATATPNYPSVRDASLKTSDALANGNGAANGTGIDLGPLTGISSRTELSVLLVSAPALNVTQLPNGCTVTYTVQQSATSNFASTTNLAAGLIVQTGSTGAAAATARVKIPSNAGRYIRTVATGAANGNTAVGDCSAKSFTMEVLF